MRKSLGIRADVAQLVEQRFRKPPVGSSSLPVGSAFAEEFACPVGNASDHEALTTI
jgi:hypothetical protein